jgi:hypothetical protein
VRVTVGMSKRDWLSGFPWYQKVMIWAVDHLRLSVAIGVLVAMGAVVLLLRFF